MRGQIQSIQHLRFLAAAIVLFGHAIHEVNEAYVADNYVLRLLDWGIGVDIFFVISGFVMMLVSRGKFGSPGSVKNFLLRRVERVVPLYWLFTTAMIVAIVMLPHLIDNGDLNAAYLLASFGFVPWPRADGLLRPVLAVGWTLNYEMFFYALFAVSLIFSEKIGVWVLAALIALFCVMGHAGGAPSIIKFWGDPIIIEFLAGAVIAKIYLSGVRLRNVMSYVAVFCSVVIAVALADSDFHRLVRDGLPSILFFGAYVLRAHTVEGGRVRDGLALMGDASYSLYLSHPFSINAFLVFWRKFGIDNVPIFLFVCCVVSIVVGLAVHILLERPLIRVIMKKKVSTNLVVN